MNNKEIIREAFKSLDELCDVQIDSNVKILKEAEEVIQDTDLPLTFKDLFEQNNSYVLTHDFEINGKPYFLFVEALGGEGAESCDVLYGDEFNINNITGVLVELLDDEHNFIDSLANYTDFDFVPDTMVEDAEKIASELVTSEQLGEELDDEEVTVEEEPVAEPVEEPAPEEPAPEAEAPVEEPKKEEMNICTVLAGHLDIHDNGDCSITICLKGDLDKEDSTKLVLSDLSDEECEIIKGAIPSVDTLETPEEETSESDKNQVEESCSIVEKASQLQGRVKFKKMPEKAQKLKESVFDIADEEDMEKAKQLVQNNIDEDTVEQIVDVDAETIDDLKKSYVGSIILRCPICKTMVYKRPEDLVKVEGEDELYNIEDECPHCGAKDEGFEIVGQVATLDVDPNEVPEEPISEEPISIEDSISNPDETVTLDLDTENVQESLESKPVCEKCGKEVCECANKDLTEEKEDTIVEYCVLKDGNNIEVFYSEEDAVEFAIQEEADEVLKVLYGPANEFGDREELGTETVWDSESLDTETVTLESFDESLINSLVEKYLNEVYSNIKSFETTKGLVDDDNNKMVIEGKITFNSGKEKETKFVFESTEKTKKGKYKFVGINETFSPKKAFTLIGEIKNNVLLSENLNYSYKVNDRKIVGKVNLPTNK